MWKNRNNRPHTNRIQTKQKQRHMARSKENVRKKQQKLPMDKT